jgi:hypothetical protein
VAVDVQIRDEPHGLRWKSIRRMAWADKSPLVGGDRIWVP